MSGWAISFVQRLASAAIVKEDNEPILCQVWQFHSFFEESAARIVERTVSLKGIAFKLLSQSTTAEEGS